MRRATVIVLTTGIMLVGLVGCAQPRPPAVQSPPPVAVPEAVKTDTQAQAYIDQATLLSDILRNQSLGAVVSGPEPRGDINVDSTPVGGRFLAVVTAVSSTTVTFDVLTYYNGSPAELAARRDHAQNVNGTYGRNKYAHSQKLPVDPGCVVGFLTQMDIDATMPIPPDEEGSGARELQAATWADFVPRARAALDRQPELGQFWISVDYEGQRITYMVQQYGE